MALIKCPECGKEISDKAATCPNCGCPSIDKEEAERINDTTKGIVALFLCGLGFIMAIIINDGILLLIPFILFIISLILGIKCSKKFSIIAVIISGFGVAMVIGNFLIDLLL